ncbi:MAG: type III pantothenate kinase [Paludibacteraceae bacterium]|nr:type III pantothenate kinase [Paludibacteraceae bacterium]MEE0951342.1 type III pantothenate kinase [Paludibacteraceae bacterium]MEE1069158.1 type III pantothenate kinase [Paludibacteraceae bacterium]MEE1095291.1 type III pantothenate kinase [Paludibacteraceae bacterium]MEE1253774.1 type III pantothenate kinase [Paludibacteraceae bacterium]
MNLCIDQGNSRTKVALMTDEGKIIQHFIYKTFSSADVERLFALYAIKSSIISSVINIEPAIVNALARLSEHFVLFDHNTPIPIKNGYDTPETLGQDRIAAAVGAQQLCPGENLLIIDVGSAVTYDFVSENGEYMGGNIAPGLKMRFTMLQRMTKKLPLVEVGENELIPLFGKNTRDAIAAGVIRGVAYEVKGYMRTLREKTTHFQTYMTGGNASVIINATRSSRTEKREIHHEKHLVLIGLNTILVYNKK